MARLRHAGFSCGFQADEKTMLWSKLALLAPFALTTTASDKDKQGVFADATWRARLESAVGEACAVAAAEKAAVDRETILATLDSLPGTTRSSIAEGCVSWPFSRARRHRRPHHSRWTELWARRAGNAQTRCRSTRAPEQRVAPRHKNGSYVTENKMNMDDAEIGERPAGNPGQYLKPAA